MELLVINLIVVVIVLAAFYSIITAAVRNALAQHYKVVRHYEATGEWLKGAGGFKEAPTNTGPKLAKPPKNLQ